MTHQSTLKTASLLSVLLFSLHWADEIARGIEPGTVTAVWGLLILFIWLYATLALIDRRSGLVVVLLASLLAAGVPVIHMQGAGLVGGRIATNSTGALFWVWTLIALGTSGMISLALSVRALWGLRS